MLARFTNRVESPPTIKQINVVGSLLVETMCVVKRRAVALGPAARMPQTRCVPRNRAYLRSTPSMVQVSVDDSGIGVSKPDRERVFSPLFTTKAGSRWVTFYDYDRIASTTSSRRSAA